MSNDESQAMSMRLAIAAPIRSEAPYLLEWIAYHRSLGIEYFFLADNGGDDDTSALLQALDRCGIVTRLDWRGHRYFQLAFYQQAIELARQSADGLFLIDADEFLRPEVSDGSLAGLVQAWFADDAASAVAINWAIYGTSGEIRMRDLPVIERFRRRAPQDYSINRHVKSLVRVDRCSGPDVTPHAVTLRSGGYVNTRGEPVEWDQSKVAMGITKKVVWDRLRIDHFVLKSRAEFERKRERGSAMAPRSATQRFKDEYFTAHDRNDVDDPMPAILVERMKAELRRISDTLAGAVGSASSAV